MFGVVFILWIELLTLGADESWHPLRRLAELVCRFGQLGGISQQLFHLRHFRRLDDQQLQASPSNPNTEPFRINDYTAAAAKINATAQDLVKLLQAFGQTLAPGKFDGLPTRLDTLTRKKQASGKELVDYTIRQTLYLGLILIGSACGMVLVSAVVFWRLKKKFA
jgi:hypothetical protein